jgi:hypothetical protein
MKKAIDRKRHEAQTNNAKRNDDSGPPKRTEMENPEFDEWLKSITFVDRDGNPLPRVLTPDESEDPENDRAEQEK